MRLHLMDQCGKNHSSSMDKRNTATQTVLHSGQTHTSPL